MNCLILAAISYWLAFVSPLIQDAATAASQPADARQPIRARVIDVVGDAQHAPRGSADWRPCQVGDQYDEMTKIRTGIRSAVKLQVGDEEPYTAILIESVGLTELSEAYSTAQTKRVRVGLRYGKIRAGVAESGLKSDFTVDSPVATLSKRGTWNFGMSYEPVSDRFEMFLIDEGLVDALHRATGQTRRVLPGELVTQTMRLWLDESQLQRNVAVNDILGQGDIQIAFNRIQQDGLGVLNPGEGSKPILSLNNSGSQAAFARLLENSVAGPGIDFGPIAPGVIRRSEGFFGTGRGDDLVPVLIEEGSALVRNGAARASTLYFRRSAAEAWLKQYRSGK